MDNHYYKTKNINKRKRHTLHALGVGFVFFALLVIMSKFLSLSVCPVKRLLGVSCFGCGMTRGFVSVLKLDFISATKYNVMSVPLFVGIGLYSLFAVTDVCFNKNFIYKIEKQLSKLYMYPLYVTILVIATILNNT